MFYIFSRVLSLTCAFLYPAYASYKTLSKRPASEPDLERWLMYWSVLGVILAAEYVGEWVVSWIPFYWLIKTSFLLYLALPQTQGSTFVYRSHLAPFFDEHETEIDSTVTSVKARVFVYLQDKLRALWDALYAGLLNQASVPPSNAAGVSPGGSLPVEGGSGQPPTLTDPMSGATKMMWGMWQSYGPSIVMKGTALIAAASANASAAATGARREAAALNQDSGVNAASLDEDDELGESPVVPTAAANNLYGQSLDAPLTRRTRTSSGLSSHSSGSGHGVKSPFSDAGNTNVAQSVYLHEGAPSTDPTGRYERINREDAEGAAAPRSPGGGGWFGWGRSETPKIKSE